MFNGLVSKIVTVDARKKVDETVRSLYDETFPVKAAALAGVEEKGFKWEDEIFKCSRGLSLGSRTLVPPAEVMTEKNIGVIFCHGYADHLRWNTLNNLIHYAQEGFLVTGLELEGHGISENKLGLLPNIDTCIVDLYEFIKQQQEKFPLKKWFLHGESMGGMVALLMSIKAKEMEDVKIDGVILASPMCKIAKKVKPPAPMVGTLLFAAKFFPTLSIVPSAINDDLIFKDEEYRKKAMKDPLRYFGKPRLATAGTLYKSTTKMEKNLDKITTPFFVLHGKKDVVTTFEASVELYEKSSVDEADKKILLAEEGWHGLLCAEPEEDMVKYWESIVAWINERAAME